MCSGNDLLRVLRERAKKRIATRHVELAKDIVDQQHRRCGEMFREQACGSELERNDQRALLAFAGELRGLSVQRKGEIVAMRPKRGLTKARVFLSRRDRKST